MTFRRWVPHFLLFAIAAGASGCAIADAYAPHAVAYNLEAEQAQDQQLLLNIVRASLRLPMQFTSVSSITGTQSVSGTASLTVPFATVTRTGTFGGTVGGGPTFVVPVLDTQEFYRGILQGIPGELVDLLLHSGYSPELVYNLLIEKIVMKKIDTACPTNDHRTECEFYVYNDVSSDTQAELFHSVVRYLVALGLSTEPRDDPSKPQPASSTGGSGNNTSGNNANGDANSTSKSALNPLPVPYVFCFAPKDWHMEDLLTRESFCGYYDQTQQNKKMTPTLTATANGSGAIPTTLVARAKIPPSEPAKKSGDQSAKPTACDTIGAVKTPNSKSGDTRQIGRVAILTACLSDEIVADMACVMGSYDNHGYYLTEAKLWNNFRGPKKQVKVRFTFYIRSTSDLLKFLGQVVARDLTPGIFRPQYDDYPRRVWIGDSATFRLTSEATEPFDPYTMPRLTDQSPVVPRAALSPELGPCRRHFDNQHYLGMHHDHALFRENLFVLERDKPLHGNLAVSYNSHVYSVPEDLVAAGWTPQVLGVVKELLAVNTSAATLPQSSVISVVNPQ